MITIIILICLTIFIISAIKGNQKNTRNIASKKPLVSASHITYGMDNDVWKARRRRLDNIEQRRKRHDRIWSVLFIANSIHHCQAEITTKRDWQYLDQAIEAVKEHKPQYRDIMAAIRFCKIEHALGNCDRELSKQDLFTLRNIRQLIETKQLPVKKPDYY